MTILRRLGTSLFLAGVSVSLPRCLPKDTRPVPSRLDVTVTAEPLRDGGGSEPSTRTVDGWTISYDRVLAGIRASLDGDGCPDYYNDGYTRILDLGVPGPQRLSTLYSLGHCDFGFRVQAPSVDPYVPLGEHVTPADHAFLNVPAIDPYTMSKRNGTTTPVLTGIALYVKGAAEKGGVVKTFGWAFRQRATYRNCVAPRASANGTSSADASRRGADAAVEDAALPLVSDAGSAGPRGIDLASGGVASVDIRMRLETLFFDTPNLVVASPRFDVLARADDQYGDGDGEVTLAELGLVPLADVGGGGRYEQPPPAKPDAVVWTNLEDFVYLGLFPKVGRYEDTGTCESSAEPGGR